ncbi:MAG: LamG-like jellyroll fold domain-containing protein [Bacteroidia bacterium]
MKIAKLFTALVIPVFSFIGTNAQTACLVADYPLNGNATDVHAANNGTLYGPTPTKDRFGRANSAMQFNGSSDWVKLGTDADFQKRTISLWFKADTFLTGGSYGHVFSTDNANMQFGACGFTLDNTSGTNRINLGLGANVKRYTSNVKKGTWYHCAIVANTSQIKYYINGQLFDSATNNSTLHSNDGNTKALLGSSRKIDRFFKGAIDDVKIFDCALSNAEINALYMLQIVCPVATYPFDGDAKDASVNKKDATLYGTSYTKDRTGKSNSAIYFNGTSDWVQLGTDADFQERTISLWFKADTFLTGGSYGHVFSTDNANFQYGACGITLDNSGGSNRINLGIGANVKRYTNNVKKDIWYHCAIVANTSQIKYYINGQLFDSAANNSTLHSNDGDPKAHLGSSRKTDRFFKGAIDEVRISSCALSKAEISQLYTLSTRQILVTAKEFKAYPNPANNELSIEIKGNDTKRSLDIYNMQGQKVMEFQLEKSKSTINVALLEAGIYTLVLTDNLGTSTCKFLKK